jgi:hypothetical protein
MTASSQAERMNIRLKEAILATCSTEECQKWSYEVRQN